MNHSRQRDMIMEFLKSTKSHPTADEVYRNVKQKEPDISLGTVYRNLNLLADNNMILRLHMNDGIDHFDADISEHHHLYCRECKRVYDLEMKLPISLNKLVKTADSNCDDSVDGCVIFFHGTCAKCKAEHSKAQ